MISLPLLTTLEEALHSQKGCLKGWHCIYVQHLLRSNHACVEFLVRMGLDRNNLMIFGKGYSTNSDVLSVYEREGIAAHNSGNHYRYEHPFDCDTITSIASHAKKLRSTGVSNLLLIDEGGLAIQALARCHPESFKRLAVTELTARGAPWYGLLSELAPIVDVARCKIKKTIEAPIIADSMIQNLELELGRVAKGPLHKHRISLVGVGAIGSAIASALAEKGLKVVKFDNDHTRSDAIPIEEVVSSSDIILSSTGGGSDWSHWLQKQTKDLILVNCGSSDVEYRIWELRNAMAGNGFDLLVENEKRPWLGEVQLKSAQVAFHFLRGGFPINFDGSEDPIPAKKIQLTRAILMAGAIQSVACKDPGVHELHVGVQEMLHAKWCSIQ